MRRLFCGAVVLLGITQCGCGLPRTLDGASRDAWRIKQTLMKSVVIVCDSSGRSGTGWVVGRHNGRLYVMTAGHVLYGHESGTWVIRYFRHSEADLTLHSRVEAIRCSSDSDFCLLSCRDNPALQAVTLSGSIPKVGDPVLAAGHPCAIDPPMVTFGRIYDVSLKSGRVFSVYLDAGMWYGSSGGPVVDMDCRVIGMIVKFDVRYRWPKSDRAEAIGSFPMRRFLIEAGYSFLVE